MLAVLLSACSPKISPTAVTPTASIETHAPPTQSKLAIEIAEYLEGLAARHLFSGAVLIARDDEVLLERAYGMQNRALGLPNKIETKFNLGSMNKMFTAVAIMQLVEQGKLSVDDHLIDVLPDYPNREVAKIVTIHQLLTHTAGMGDCFTGDFFTTPDDQLKSVAGYLPLFVNKPLQFAPGTQYAYSNEGYMVLGLVIEKITGQSYYEYVRNHIYAPAGMADTDAYELDTAVPNLAIGYTTQDAIGNDVGGTPTDNTSLMPIKGTPAGGGYSTVDDLLRFRHALLNDQLLRPESTSVLLEGKVEIREGVQYAYGFLDKVVGDEHIVGHGGNAPGICDFMDLYINLGYTIIALTNTDTGCMDLKEFFREHVTN